MDEGALESQKSTLLVWRLLPSDLEQMVLKERPGLNGSQSVDLVQNLADSGLRMD